MATTRSLSGLWDRSTGEFDSSPALREGVIDNFHRLYYSDDSTWRNLTYRGVTTWKCPLDLWIYQEIIHELHPDLIIETGTAYGGSALYLADLCDLSGSGEVVTIDITDRAGAVSHPRLTKVIGSSADPAVRDRVVGDKQVDRTVMVILDSDHTEGHVLAELRLWADVVTPGSYLIVEDTNINGHPVYPEFGPGPAEAVARFTQERPDFEPDLSRHKLLLTWNRGGYLRKSE